MLKPIRKIDKVSSLSGSAIIGAVAGQYSAQITASVKSISGFLISSSSAIANFVAPFPELQLWMKYISDQAEVLKDDNEINQQDK